MRNNELLKPGFFPIRIDPDDQEWKLTWLDFGKDNFQEPFYELDVMSRIRKEGDCFQETGLSALFDVKDTMQAQMPSGFIFHMSRCGSTLLGNILRHHPNSTVISEPEILDKILMADQIETNRHEVLELFRNAVISYCQKREPSDKHNVMKFPSYLTVFAEYIFESFPDVPAVFLYRDPVEVLVSNLKDPSQAWFYSRKILKSNSAEIIEENSVLENCAIALKRTCEGFINHMNPDHCIVANYNQISVPLLQRILDLFNMPYDSSLLDRMSQEANFYSKRRDLVFRDDSDDKQKEASKKLKQVAKKHLFPIHEKLETLKIDLS